MQTRIGAGASRGLAARLVDELTVHPLGQQAFQSTTTALQPWLERAI